MCAKRLFGEDKERLIFCLSATFFEPW